MQTIDLNEGTTYTIVDYQTKTGNPDDESVEERIVVRVGGSAVTSIALLRTAVEKLEDILLTAKNIDETKIGYIYLYNVKSAAGSLLKGGRLELGTRLWYEDYANKATDVTLVIRREAIWWNENIMGTDDAENQNGSATDSYDTGLNIFNCNDLSGSSPNKRCNYIDFPTGIAGYYGLPSTTCFLMKNTTNDANHIRNVWAAINVNENPATMVHNFEFEDGTGGTPTVDADCSGGDYMAITWTEVVEKQLTSMSISGANQLLYEGANYKLLMRLKTAPTLTNLYLKVKLMDGATVLADGGWHLADDGNQIQELGSLQIPPGLCSSTWGYMGALNLVLFGKTTEAGTKTLDADFLMLFPIDDGYCKYTVLTDDFGYLDILQDLESISDQGFPNILVDNANPYIKKGVVRYGNPFRLQNNRRVRFYFLHDLTDGSAPIARSMLVKIGTVLRYLTI